MTYVGDSIFESRFVPTAFVVSKCLDPFPVLETSEESLEGRTCSVELVNCRTRRVSDCFSLRNQKQSCLDGEIYFEHLSISASEKYDSECTESIYQLAFYVDCVCVHHSTPFRILKEMLPIEPPFLLGWTPHGQRQERLLLIQGLFPPTPTRMKVLITSEEGIQYAGYQNPSTNPITTLPMTLERDFVPQSQISVLSPVDQIIDLNYWSDIAHSHNQIGGFRPIHHYSYAGSVELVKKELNGKSSYLNLPDARGRTPLFWACVSKRTEVVKELLSRGANIDIGDYYGFTPSHVATFLGDTEIVSLLRPTK